MEVVQPFVTARSRKLVYVASFTGLVGAVSFVLNAPGALDGEVPALGRALLGLIGAIAATLLKARPRQGWLVALVWAAVQVPFIAWDTAGSPTAQVLYLPLALSSTTSVNGVVTSSSAIGLNLIGLVCTVVISRWRADWLYRHRQDGVLSHCLSPTPLSLPSQ